MLEHGAWNFNELEPHAFQAHIESSIPGYCDGHRYITYLSDYFVGNDSLIYDLGCSSGYLLEKLASYHSNKERIKFIGIDMSESLLYRGNHACCNQHKSNQVLLLANDIEVTEFERCNLFIMYYTLQFIPPLRRQDLINRIYSSLQPGGALFLFEKILAPNPRFQDMLTATYLEYKRNNGFGSDEIIDKMLSLKGVLTPFTSEENHNLLGRAGFSDIITVFKSLCFEGLLAIKPHV